MQKQQNLIACAPLTDLNLKLTSPLTHYHQQAQKAPSRVASHLDPRAPRMTDYCKLVYELH